MAKKDTIRRYYIDADDRKKIIFIDRDGTLSDGDKVLLENKLSAGYKIQFIDSTKKKLNPDSKVFIKKDGLRKMLADKKPELVAEFNEEIAKKEKNWMTLKKKYLDLLGV